MSEQMVAGLMLDFDEDGFMADYTVWNEEIAEQLASSIGIDPLTERHWQVITFCRNDFMEQGEPPTLRRITSESGVPTKELYQLFPKGPAKKVAYIAGLKKPTGCI